MKRNKKQPSAPRIVAFSSWKEIEERGLEKEALRMINERRLFQSFKIVRKSDDDFSHGSVVFLDMERPIDHIFVNEKIFQNANGTIARVLASKGLREVLFEGASTTDFVSTGNLYRRVA